MYSRPPGNGGSPPHLEALVNGHRIRRKVHGNFVPTATLILTFDRTSLPDRIRCGFFKPRMRQYVPNPLRCFKCQSFGHTQEYVCLMQFVYPVARRHIVLPASFHHIASTVKVLTAQILVTARNFRWRGKSRRSGPQISCHFRRLGVVTRPSTRSIFHEV